MTKFRLMTILFLSTIALSKTAFGQYQLYGEWEVFCPIEITEGKQMQFCDLCELGHPTNKKLDQVVWGFEAKIDKDSIYLKNSEGTKPIKYTWDKKTNSIEFQHKQKVYKFISLASGSGDNLVLKDKDCLLLTFTRKKKQ